MTLTHPSLISPRLAQGRYGPRLRENTFGRGTRKGRCVRGTRRYNDDVARHGARVLVYGNTLPTSVSVCFTARPGTPVTGKRPACI